MTGTINGVEVGQAATVEHDAVADTLCGWDADGNLLWKAFGLGSPVAVT